MKKTVLASIAALAFIMAGCAPKAAPDVDMSSSTDGTQIGGSDQSGLDSANTTSASDRLAALMAQLGDDANKVYFDFDKFNIRSDMQNVIDTNANLFNSSEAQGFSIKVEGNCDEWGTDEYNYALGLKRAKSAKDALVGKGVNAERIMVVSFGESNPVCTEKNKSCWDKNRRAEFKVLP